MTAVVEAMTTNETYFFRDKTPFENFRSTVLPAVMRARPNSRYIRIWCAAASTGQEPYSLAMLLKEMGREIDGWRIDIFASDISNEVLEKARQGVYSQFEAQRGLPIHLLIKYFTQIGDLWQIAPAIRSMVRYHQVNMLSDFAHLGMFDVVFCRNLLIYLDQGAKAGLLDRLAQSIYTDGYLVLGAAETVVGVTDSFKVMPDKRGLYIPAAREAKSALPGAPRSSPRLVAVNGAL
jgi:chemotaxis protein methyltransferase CheR